MPRFSQTAYSLATDPSSRAALVDRLAIIAAGGASELTPARVLELDRIRVATDTYSNVGAAGDQLAGAVLWDTGPLAAGEYELEMTLDRSAYGAAGSQFGQSSLQHRNAANNGNITGFTINPVQQAVVNDDQADAVTVRWRRFTVALNERIRLVKDSADVASAYQSWSVKLRAV